MQSQQIKIVESLVGSSRMVSALMVLDNSLSGSSRTKSRFDAFENPGKREALNNRQRMVKNTLPYKRLWENKRLLWAQLHQKH